MEGKHKTHYTGTRFPFIAAILLNYNVMKNFIKHSGKMKAPYFK